MKNIFLKLIVILFSISISYNAFAAELDFDKNMNNSINNNLTTLKINWTCDSSSSNKIKINIKQDNQIKITSDIECKNENFELNLDFCNNQELINIKNGEIILELFHDVNGVISTKEKKLNKNLNQWSCNKWSSPNPEALVLENDDRVCVWDCFKNNENEEKDESKKIIEKPAIPENLFLELPDFIKKEKNKKEKNVESISGNWNKFTHKKLSCNIINEINENFKKDLNTSFNDISSSKYFKEIKNLENTSHKVIVWTKDKYFEPSRNITKSELLWIALKANCYDLSSNTRKNWQERTIGIWVAEGIIENSNIRVNEEITKDEAYWIIIKAWKINTGKNDNFEAMKHIWIINKNEDDKKSKIKREQAVNLLIKILSIYKK